MTLLSGPGAAIIGHRRLNIVIAPDSFKGSARADEIAHAIADGWREARPADHLTVLAQADGGEGTLDAIAAAAPRARKHVISRPVCGPDRQPVAARWIELPGAVGVVELAESSGLPLMAELAPTRATSRGLGQVIRSAIDHGCQRLVVGLGGSASTDAGIGVLLELGLCVYDKYGHRLDIADSLDLTRIAAIDASGLMSPPDGGVEVLTDTSAPLCGRTGAAHMFGAQKGAGAEVRRDLDSALAHFADLAEPVFDIDRSEPGTGAAGGVGFGLRAWGATLHSGAERIAELTELSDAIDTSDLVITGEGRFDSTSLTGKLVGTVLDRCRSAGVRNLVIAGDIAAPAPDLAVSLSEVAGSAERAIAAPQQFAHIAAREAAVWVSSEKALS
ncbi:glycerate kinase [Gordonia sp. CPCC 205515]|uniref:glycerate kinase n=1 Tax=Gordonia sp. CPCC 205515 TaxID=3140791 RepID=UPI003AF34189